VKVILHIGVRFRYPSPGPRLAVSRSGLWGHELWRCGDVYVGSTDRDSDDWVSPTDLGWSPY